MTGPRRGYDRPRNHATPPTDNCRSGRSSKRRRPARRNMGRLSPTNRSGSGSPTRRTVTTTSFCRVHPSGIEPPDFPAMTREEVLEVVAVEIRQVDGVTILDCSPEHAKEGLKDQVLGRDPRLPGAEDSGFLALLRRSGIRDGNRARRRRTRALRESWRPPIPGTPSVCGSAWETRSCGRTHRFSRHSCGRSSTTP